MPKKIKSHCALCEQKECRDGKDCFSTAELHSQYYQTDPIGKIHKSAAAVEAHHYCQEPRLRETILFAKELGCKIVGLAFCVGLSAEAKIIEEILAQDFKVVSVCCKMGGIDKKTFALEQIHPENTEITCNPAGQAEILNRAGTDLNILCGLCVGHDAIFGMVSHAPVTTLIVKDRVLAHNPIGAVYSQYIRRNFLPTDASKRSKK
ncbi:MAG: DUF1847 domain-containing protein [Candidatus Omnitrophota bacterium]|jgi:uncharacterized metal-binding protein|nr:MAG: DUF1847 domain-containing protein [Candidatus Omnitrophota bacterium]